MIRRGIYLVTLFPLLGDFWDRNRLETPGAESRPTDNPELNKITQFKQLTIFNMIFRCKIFNGLSVTCYAVTWFSNSNFSNHNHIIWLQTYLIPDSSVMICSEITFFAEIFDASRKWHERFIRSLSQPSKQISLKQNVNGEKKLRVWAWYFFSCEHTQNKSQSRQIFVRPDFQSECTWSVPDRFC